MEKILQKKALPDWVIKLKNYKIIAPVKIENHWDFGVLRNLSRINLDYPNTVISPKKHIFPQREIYFRFRASESGDYEILENLPEETPTVIFGIRPCDGKAVSLMDKVFGGDINDPYYWKRRNSTILVGLSCIHPPSENCFCTSVDGSPFSRDGMDILLTDMDDTYYVESITKKGEGLIRQASTLFKDPGETKKSQKKQLKSRSEKEISRKIPEIKNIPGKLEALFDSDFWDSESLSCIRCGICTYLCPTCHCFDINDETKSNSPLEGERVRTWDNCQFPDFTMHSSGHNPRPDRASRLRQRTLHKFQYFVKLHQTYQCTGCGRCVSQCPVGIDIIKILNKVNAR